MGTSRSVRGLQPRICVTVTRRIQTTTTPYPYTLPREKELANETHRFGNLHGCFYSTVLEEQVLQSRGSKKM